MVKLICILIHSRAIMQSRKDEKMDKKNLELIEAFEKFSLYYDRVVKKLWIFDGERYFGTDMKHLKEWLES